MCGSLRFAWLQCHNRPSQQPCRRSCLYRKATFTSVLKQQRNKYKKDNILSQVNLFSIRLRLVGWLTYTSIYVRVTFKHIRMQFWRHLLRMQPFWDRFWYQNQDFTLQHINESHTVTQYVWSQFVFILSSRSRSSKLHFFSLSFNTDCYVSCTHATWPAV